MRRCLGLAFLSLSLAAASGHAQEGGDTQAQIVYAYQAEDINQLASLVQNLANQVKAAGTAAGGADASLRYHLAHAQYRFGLLAQGKRARDAAPAFADCVDQLKSILEQDVKSVEALVLQSACYDELAKRRRLEAVLLRTKAEERLNAAFRLDPRNPRVLYFVAQAGFARSKPHSPDAERAFAQLGESAKIFDQSSATRNDIPGWGHAQAYLALGVQLQSRGEALGARNWIEKALIVAPDYKAAQRQMASLVHR
jgi:tetratricopeptide (TPR) repeat protein